MSSEPRPSPTTFSLNASVEASGFEILEGSDAIETWRPDGGRPKSFRRLCGGHLFSGEPDEGFVSVRLGAVDGDPGIPPDLAPIGSSAPGWDAIPDDGLPRFPERRPG